MQGGFTITNVAKALQTLQLAIAALCALNSCSRPPIVLEGRIDQEMFKNLSATNSVGHEVVINSTGGDISAALEIAENILRFNNTVIVDEKCISGCAEYVLPATEKVIFKNNPVIGFHWNPRLNWALYFENGGDTEGCDLDLYFLEKDFLSKVDVNPDFWQLTLKKMGLDYYKIHPEKSEKCQNISRRFTNRLWLPTSEHLKADFGLKFEGSVCADEFQSCSQHISTWWDTGESIMIGDERFSVP